MSNKRLTERPEFRALQKHHAALAPALMRDLFAKDPARFEKLHLKQPGILFDYSKHRVSSETIKLLTDLAKACGVEKQRGAMFAGETVNITENRAALHVALRGSTGQNIMMDGENVAAYVGKSLAKIKSFTQKIRADKKFTAIVNVGIGGSDLGARMACAALEPFADGPSIHFLANIDGAAATSLFNKLNPETTLFIVVSKTFSTLETLANAKAAKDWLAKHLKDGDPAAHFAAVTENTKAAQDFGVTLENIFPLRPWTGGRYSVWGAAGLPLALFVGFENFEKFLKGAHAMDRHFAEAPLDANIPVIMALLGIWYRNFFDFRAHAVIPYAQNLCAFPTWLRQVDMESNGKSVDVNGEEIDYETGPVLFGEPGTNAQHAFFQSLHQGIDVIPCDFILTKNPTHDLTAHHNALNANALAQSKALMEGIENSKEPFRACPGNRPSSALILDCLDPYHLGLLMALYEHKVFVQGTIWNINSFDQWGVELGKTIAKNITQAIENNNINITLDSSSVGLIAHLKTGR